MNPISPSPGLGKGSRMSEFLGTQPRVWPQKTSSASFRENVSESSIGSAEGCLGVLSDDEDVAAAADHPGAPDPGWPGATRARETGQKHSRSGGSSRNARHRSETVGMQICFLHLSHSAQVRLCENFSVHIVNTICHTACPDAAFLPGRESCFIIYAACTLLKCHVTGRGKEKPRRVQDSRDPPLR